MKKLIIILVCLYLSFILHAQVAKTVNITSGRLSTALAVDKISAITNLTVTGNLDARDFRFMRDSLSMLSEIDLSGVNIVAYNGFGGTSHSENINYPANTIPEDAFGFKESLASIILPSSIISIGQGAFWCCSSMKPIIIPASVTSIGDMAFIECKGITGTLTIPPSVTSIGSWAFFGCRGITSVIIPSSVTSIGSGAFSDCRGLVENFNIPSTVKSINDYVLSDCSGITSIIIPSSVDSIGSGAFSGCSSLTTITIPSSVNFIESVAFSGCINLKSISLKFSDPSQLGIYSSSVFKDIDKNNCILYVPPGTKGAFQESPEWKDFTNIAEIQGISLVTDNVIFEPNDTKKIVYILSGVDLKAVVSDQDWLKVNSIYTTDNTYSIIIYVTSEAGDSAREAKVTVSADGYEDQIIYVTQNEELKGSKIN